MRVVNETCAGMDVHKKDVKVDLVWRDTEGNRQQEVRVFATVTKELLRMRDGLQDRGCPVVAMESTGVYGKPIFNILEGEFEVLRVNPTHLKHVPGRKTDVKDCPWIAECLEHGLLQASFIPPVEIRDLRDLTRYRRQLVNEHSAEVNRVQKVLEDANIKLASVATDVMGVSGRAMLAALMSGERNAEVSAELAKGRLRNKKGELALALQGLFRPHHVLLLTQILSHLEYLEESIAELEAKIEEMCRPFEEQIRLLDTIPGVDRRSGQDLTAEIGVNMDQFPSHKHLCSWSGMSPGNNESAGKRYSGRTPKGNKWLKAICVECGHAAGRTKETYLGALYHRLAGRKGKKRAAVAAGHSILEAAYFILRDKVGYRDLGPDHFDKINRKHIIRYHVRRLQSLGLKVDIPPGVEPA